MSKDEALERWLEDELPSGVGDYVQHSARAAWHAAVKHTLTFVVEELHKGPYHEGNIKFSTIEAIMRMKP